MVSFHMSLFDVVNVQPWLVNQNPIGGGNTTVMSSEALKMGPSEGMGAVQQSLTGEECTAAESCS